MWLHVHFGLPALGVQVAVGNQQSGTDSRDGDMDMGLDEASDASRARSLMGRRTYDR